MAGKHVITLSRSSVEPFLQFSSRRDLREKAFRAWIARGDNGGKTDNKAHHRRDDGAAHRAGQAARLSRRSRITGSTTPWRRRRTRCAGCWKKSGQPARKAALADRDALQELIAEEGGNFKLAPWDWRYYAEKLRKRRCDFDEAEVKPYFQLDRVIEAAFYGAQKLFGLSFHPVDVPVWHPDVRSWEVRGADGSHRRHFLRRLFRAAEQAWRRLDGHACATRRSSTAMSARSCST